MAEIAGTPSPIGSIETPLWRVRLRLMMRGFRTNFALFAENPIGLVGVAVIAFYFSFIIIHPILMNTVWDPNMYNPITGYDVETVFHPAPPSSTHLLGTDPLGRDVLSQLMWSTRSEFILGMVAALVTVIIATTIGAVSAFYGGAIDTFFMRLADIVIMLPYITILIVMSALFDLTLPVLALVLGLLGGLGGATIIIKSQALTIKVHTYIEAARVAGGGNGHIILNHIIPNLLPLSFLYMMFAVNSAIASRSGPVVFWSIERADVVGINDLYHLLLGLPA